MITISIGETLGAITKKKNTGVHGWPNLPKNICIYFTTHVFYFVILPSVSPIVSDILYSSLFVYIFQQNKFKIKMCTSKCKFVIDFA
jgi:hypothetical protein